MAGNFPTIIRRDDRPKQFPEPFTPFLPEVDRFLWVAQARTTFAVDGAGLTAAVLDTGLNTAHVDFAGRIPTQKNFTHDNGGDPDDAADGDGHGTNVAGIIAAKGLHTGIAPGAGVIPIKVLPNQDDASFEAVDAALQWVIDNRKQYRISVVCMSLGDGGNYTDDEFLADDPTRRKIRQLRDERVAVVVAAGNDYFVHGSKQGMCFPAIVRECISVGAVYDADEGAFSYGSGAQAFSSRPGQITPFSQRLHRSVNTATCTDLFAPGAPVTSSGIMGERGESTQQGTSQATPVTAGLALLLQDFYERATGELPTVTQLVTWLRRGGITIHDGDDENDNVQHTNCDYVRVDALSALDAVRRHLVKSRVFED